MDTRRFPRTMNEAFPGSVEYSCAIERPYRTPRRTWGRVIVAALLCGVITLLVQSVVSFPS